MKEDEMDEWGNMKAVCLRELGGREVTIPARWKTAIVYDSLIEDGCAAPIVNVGPLVRGYRITDQGRKRLREISDTTEKSRAQPEG
jgi:hypothetical protein